LQPVGASCLGGAGLLAQPREVGGEHGRGQQNRMSVDLGERHTNLVFSDMNVCVWDDSPTRPIIAQGVRRITIS
jgi:hypothetical protein